MDLARCAHICRRAGHRSDPDEWPLERLLYETTVVQAIDSEDRLKSIMTINLGIMDLFQALVSSGKEDSSRDDIGKGMRPVLEGLIAAMRRPLE